MEASLGLVVVALLIAVALAFDFINGLHDAANSIATVVSTRVLSPRMAVFWAAFFNFVAFLVFDQHVAKTMGTGVIDPSLVDTHVIFGALVGAILWNLFTWWLGLPSSSSHALIGGLVGAAVAKTGSFAAVQWQGVGKIVSAIVLSPVIGYVLAMALMVAVTWAFRRNSPYVVDRRSRRLQFVSAALYSLGHGGNDAQKTMGIIAALLFSTGHLKSMDIPFWIVLICHAAIGLGTLSGGWRIVRTMGMRITTLKPIGGSCAEFAGATTLIGASLAGIPVSTTHTITGAIMGVGSVRRFSAVRWGVARTIIFAWILTIPASATVAGLVWLAAAALAR